MKHPLWSLIGILGSTLIIIVLYSIVNFEFTIPEIVIEKSRLKKYINNPLDTINENSLADNFAPEDDSIFITDTIIKRDTLFEEKVSLAIDTVIKIDTIVNIDTSLLLKRITTIDTVLVTDTVIQTSAVAARRPAGTLDTTSQHILLIGDSMLENLRLRLKDYCEHNNHTMKAVIWYSSQTEWFGRHDTLRYFINKFKPSYIIFVIGANELFVRDIIERRQKYVKHIIKQLDEIPYVWVGPPNWADDTGINEMILKNVGKTRYFPSKELTYTRKRDGAHPTKTSAFAWMDSLAKWIETSSMYPILLKKPTISSKKLPYTVVLKPLQK